MTSSRHPFVLVVLRLSPPQERQGNIVTPLFKAGLHCHPRTLAIDEHSTQIVADSTQIVAEDPKIHSLHIKPLLRGSMAAFVNPAYAASHAEMIRIEAAALAKASVIEILRATAPATFNAGPSPPR